MKKLLLLVAVAGMLVQPCFATATLEIQNYSAKDLKDLLVRYYIKQGLGVNVVNDYSIVATKVYTGALGVAMASGVYGSKVNMHPELRYNYKFVQNGKNVLLQLTMMQVNDAGTAFQKVTYFKPTEEINTLNSINTLISGYYTFGFSAIKQKDYYKIANVDKNIAKDLENNYLLVEIDGKPASEVSLTDFSKIFGVSQLKSIKCKIKADKKAQPYEIVLNNKFIKPMEL